MINLRKISRQMTNASIVIIAAFSLSVHAQSFSGNDWPTYMHDNLRSGSTKTTLQLPLTFQWEYHTTAKPAPAWPDPAEHDYHWRSNYNLEPTMVFDRALPMVASGDLVFFASSGNDSIYCINLAGKEQWHFFAQAPIRLSPTFYQNKVYFGSDDGYAYCLKADNGELIWKYKAVDADRWIPGNQRMISSYPIRTGIMIRDDKAIYCTGLFPQQGVFLIELNPQTGKELNRQKLDISSQGYLKIEGGKLYATKGRVKPAAIATFVNEKEEIVKRVFKKPQGFKYGLIKTGDILIAGGDNRVGAFDLSGKKKLWEEKIDGRAYELIVIDGRLLVSTDRGNIYCFGNTKHKQNIKKKFDKLGTTSVFQEESLAEYRRAAESILKKTGINKGYCLVLGSNKGKLAYVLAELSDLQIIGIEEDMDQVAASRKLMDACGLYGSKITIFHGKPDKLPYGKNLFNLIVSEEPINQDDTKEVLRVLRPYGGTICVGSPSEKKNNWSIIKKDGLEGAGNWTHQYGNAGNSSYGDEGLIKKNMLVQWFGQPGPRKMIDRHSRPHSPLSTNGMLYALGQQVLYGIDAYNGTVVWERGLPEIQTRVNLPRDCGYMAADSDAVYIAVKTKCLRIDAKTGQTKQSYKAPLLKSVPVENLYDWGYLAIEKNSVFGSIVRRGTFYSDAKGPWYDGNNKYQDSENAKICCDGVFCMDKDSGNLRWVHNGVIIHSTITIGDGHMYFIENRNKNVVKRRFNRQVRLKELWKDMFMVAINVETGKISWQKPVTFEEGKIVFYMSYADGKLIVTSSPFTSYWLYVFNAKDGTANWQKESKYRQDRNTLNHGGHMQHPVVMNGIIYQDPHAWDLQTGEMLEMTLVRNGHGCGTLSGADGFLMGRGDWPRLYDTGNKFKSTPLSSVNRPGCWLNMIPAGGLVLIPESSSGCTCEYQMQTSIAFVAE